jgi:hypothetical protein
VAMPHPVRGARGDQHGTHTHPESIHRGEEHKGARLTEAAVVSIRARTAAGDSQRSLALAYGVSRSTIRSIVRRTAWSHVP